MNLAQVNISENLYYFHSNARPPTATIGGFISRLLPNIIAFAGVIFFIFIIVGGFSLISSSGKQSSPQEVAKAQATITWGIIGFLIVAFSYLILQLMSSLLGFNLLNPKIGI